MNLRPWIQWSGSRESEGPRTKRQQLGRYQYTLFRLCMVLLITSFVCSLLACYDFDRVPVAFVVSLFGAAFLDVPIQRYVRRVRRLKGQSAAAGTNFVLNLVGLAVLIAVVVAILV